MKVLIQRVKSASVSVDGKLVSSIGRGILAFAAVSKDDTLEDTIKSASKLLKLKLWDDTEEGKRWKLNVVDISGEILCVSQFTLLASTKKGAKPDFHKSAGPDKARDLYMAFFSKVKELYAEDKVKDGVFQAMMDVALVNDGPVGVDYTSLDGVVTLEFNTDPPPLDLPGDSTTTTLRGNVDIDQLGDELRRLSAEFVMPPELLE